MMTLSNINVVRQKGTDVKRLTSMCQWFGHRAIALSHYLIALMAMAAVLSAAGSARAQWIDLGGDNWRLENVDNTTSPFSGGNSVSGNATITNTGNWTLGSPIVPVDVPAAIQFTADSVFTLNGDATGQGSLTLYSNKGSGNTYGVRFDVTNTSVHQINGEVNVTQTVSNSNYTYALARMTTGTDLKLTLDEFGAINAVDVGDGACGVAGQDGVTFYGDLAGDISGTADGQFAYGASSIEADLTINGDLTGTVTARSVNSSNAYAIKGETGLTVNGDVSGSISAQSATSDAHGLYVFDGDLVITGDISGAISATADTSMMAYGLYTDDESSTLSIGNLSGTITATAGSMVAVGVMGKGDLEITGSLSGEVTATAAMFAWGVMAENNLEIGSLSGEVIATATGDQAIALGAGGKLNGGGDTPLTIADGAIVAATANDSAFAIASTPTGTGWINVKVEKGATVSAVSSSGTGTLIYAFRSIAFDDTVELVAGSTIIGHIDLNLYATPDNDTLILSGQAADSTTLDGDIRNVENINITGGTWNLNGTITHGTLTMSGSGTLNLSGTNTFTDPIFVNGGDLFVNGSLASNVITNPGGTLCGNGSVQDVTNNGAVAPGNSIGTLVVTGNYTHNAGATLEVEINDTGQSDLVDASGSATINGGSLDIQAEAGTYTKGMTYTILEADGGVSGTFDEVLSNLPGLRGVLIYNPYDIQLQLALAQTYLSMARTFNQRAVASYLDAQYDGATGDLRYVMDSLDALSPSEARNAFDQMDGEIYGTLGSVGVQSTTLVYLTLMNRLRPDLSVCRPACWDCGDDCSQWDSWAIGYGLGGNASTDGNAHGFGYSIGGTLIGLDRYLSADDKVGMFFAYGRTHVGLNGLNASANVDNSLIGGYFTREVCRDYYTLAGGFGVDSYTVQRNIQFGEISRTANGDHNGWQSAVYLERGRTFCWNQYALQPYGALQYIHLAQNGFTESDAQSLNLKAGNIDTDSFRTLLGLRAMRPLGKPGSQVEFRSLWMHELLDPTVTTFDAEFDGIDGPNFAIDGVDLGRDWAILGTSVSWCLRQQCRLFASYDIMVNNQQTFHLASGGLEILW